MRLTKILEHQVQEADSSRFEVRDQIERNLRYYALEPLGNEQKGRSHYISPDVHDYVESKKALFSRTFLSSRQVVKFQSGGATPFGEAEAKTAYVNKVLAKAGKENMFHDLWHDAFTAKSCNLICQWKEDTEEEVITIANPLPMQAIQAALQEDPSIIDIDTSQMAFETLANGAVLASGELTVTREDSGFDFTVCAPERVYKDPESSCLDDAMWWSYEEEVAKGFLILQGYDEDQVYGLKPDRKWRSDDVQFSRTSHDGSYVSTHKKNREEVQETVTRFRTWTWLNMAEYNDDPDLDGQWEDKVALYEIHWSNDEILRKNGELCIYEVDDFPVFEWSELRISHTANGMCGADVVTHTQKVNSILKRQIIDNQNMRNNTRFEAVHDLMLNPRDLVDNKTGGVVFTEQIGSVAALPTPELSPVTFNVLQMMKEDSEMRSGLSSLTKGMNTSVLENQNAKDMVERLTNAAGSRPTADARSFAQTFLVPLFKYIVTIAKENDTSVDQTEASGQMIPIIPSQWQGEEDECEVSVALTPDEAESQAQMLLTMHNVLMQDPMSAQLYGLEQRHALLDDVFESMGISDASRYLMRPDDPNFQAQQAQIMELTQALEALQAENTDLKQGVVREQLDQGWAAINNTMMDRMEDNAREDDELAAKIRQEDRNLDIQQEKVDKSGG